MRHIYKISFTLLFSLLLFTCNKETAEIASIQETKSLEELKTDTRFISMLEEDLQLASLIKDNEAATIILAKNEFTDEDLEELAVILGFENYEKFQNHISQQQEVRAELEVEYALSTYSKEELTNVIEVAAMEIISIDPIGICLCAALYAACITTAKANYDSTVAACVQLGPLLAPACIAAAYVIYTSELAGCQAAFTACVARCL